MKLSSPAEKIEYDDNSAKVYPRNGDIFNATSVIYTVSLSVLKDDKIKIKPDLSRAKQKARTTAKSHYKNLSFGAVTTHDG